MGARCLPHPPGSLSPTTSQPWDPSLPSLQRCDTNQGNRVMRGIESAYVSIFFELIKLVELEYMGELQCIGFFFFKFIAT